MLAVVDQRNAEAKMAYDDPLEVVRKRVHERGLRRLLMSLFLNIETYMCRRGMAQFSRDDGGARRNSIILGLEDNGKDIGICEQVRWPVV